MLWEMNNVTSGHTGGEGQKPNRFTRKEQRSASWKQKMNYRGQNNMNVYDQCQGNWWYGHGNKGWKGWRNWGANNTPNNPSPEKMLKEALQKMLSEQEADAPPTNALTGLPLPAYLAQKIASSTPAQGEGGAVQRTQANIPSMLAVVMEEEQRKLDEVTKSTANKTRIAELKYLIAIPPDALDIEQGKKEQWKKELEKLEPPPQRNPTKTVLRCRKRMDEIKLKTEESNNIIQEATTQITNAKKAQEIMAREHKSLQEELNDAKKQIAQEDGSPDALKSQEEQASQEAAAHLTSEEKKGLHDGLFTAINLAMQTQECQGPYQKYVAEMQAMGKVFMPPGAWATGMMGLVAKHHEPRVTPQEPGTNPPPDPPSATTPRWPTRVRTTSSSQRTPNKRMHPCSTNMEHQSRLHQYPRPKGRGRQACRGIEGMGEHKEGRKIQRQEP